MNREQKRFPKPIVPPLASNEIRSRDNPFHPFPGGNARTVWRVVCLLVFYSEQDVLATARIRVLDKELRDDRRHGYRSNRRSADPAFFSCYKSFELRRYRRAARHGQRDLCC